MVFQDTAVFRIGSFVLLQDRIRFFRMVFFRIGFYYMYAARKVPVGKNQFFFENLLKSLLSTGE